MIAQHPEPQQHQQPEIASSPCRTTALAPPPQRNQDHQRAEAAQQGRFYCRKRAKRQLLSHNGPAPNQRRGGQRGIGGEYRWFLHGRNSSIDDTRGLPRAASTGC